MMKPRTSLQTLKTDIDKKEATLKTLYGLHPHLKGRSEVQLLAYFEIQTLEELHRIQNIKKSQTIQLKSVDLQECSSCTCMGSKGQPKDLYETEESAQIQMRTSTVHAKMQLSVYRCPSGWGWHLTKK